MPPATSSRASERLSRDPLSRRVERCTSSQDFGPASPTGGIHGAGAEVRDSRPADDRDAVRSARGSETVLGTTDLEREVMHGIIQPAGLSGGEATSTGPGRRRPPRTERDDRRYEAPRVESVVTSDDVEREAVFGGGISMNSACRPATRRSRPDEARSFRCRNAVGTSRRSTKPRVETVMTSDEVEREIHYGGLVSMT